jgi:drug/metabolite transporter (DMT)-like permease
MKYMPALTVSAVMLLGPVMSILEGMLIGVEQFPGHWTVVGGLIVTVGSGTIVMSASRQSTTVELEQMP